MLKRICVVLILTLVCSSVVLSQTSTGSISGRVLDNSGAVVPNTTVTAVQQDTNVSTTTKANELGLYSFPNVRPGMYRLETEAPGFKKLVRGGLEVQVATGIRVDLTMEVGAVTESVTITA